MKKITESERVGWEGREGVFFSIFLAYNIVVLSAVCVYCSRIRIFSCEIMTCLVYLVFGALNVRLVMRRSG